MAGWFRFYNDVLNDPKVQRLDGETFKAWCNVLCLASKNDGKLPPLADIAFALRLDENGARTVLERLLNATLIDRLNGGANGVHYAPHGWAKRQYKSDTSTDRVKRFRQRSKPVTETAPDTDTDTDVSVAKATGAEAPFDPAKMMFDAGVSLITAEGKTEAAARSWLGKAKRDYGTEAVISAIGAAKREGAVDAVAFMQRCLRQQRRTADEVPIC